MDEYPPRGPCVKGLFPTVALLEGSADFLGGGALWEVVGHGGVPSKGTVGPGSLSHAHLLPGLRGNWFVLHTLLP